jgi:hypothetical protein
LATPNCPVTRDEVYIAGSAPTEFCEVHGGRAAASSTGSWLSHIFGGGGEPKPPVDGTTKPAAVYDPNRPPNATGQGAAPPPADGSDGQQAEKKKNPFKKIFGIFGGKKKDSDKAKPKPENGDPP